MKNGILCLCLIAAMMACSDDSEVSKMEIYGEWLLIEQLLDPGDGSGSFEEVVSDKTLEFKEDGTVESSGNLCMASTGSGGVSVGTYSLDTGIIESEDCVSLPFEIRFEWNDDELIVSYPCIEPCQEKYRRK